MSTTARPMTADEFLLLPDDGMRHELIRGEVRTMSLPGGRHGKVALRIGRLVGDHVERAALGETYAAETGFLIERDPDTVRGADVAFVRRERLGAIVDPDKHVPFAPDLVVEVASPSDTPAEVAAKTDDWLAAGALVVWNAFPKTRTVTVHRAGIDTLTLTESDMLDGGDILAGFHCVVHEFFE